MVIAVGLVLLVSWTGVFPLTITPTPYIDCSAGSCPSTTSYEGAKLSNPMCGDIWSGGGFIKACTYRDCISGCTEDICEWACCNEGRCGDGFCTAEEQSAGTCTSDCGSKCRVGDTTSCFCYNNVVKCIVCEGAGYWSTNRQITETCDYATEKCENANCILDTKTPLDECSKDLECALSYQSWEAKCVGDDLYDFSDVGVCGYGKCETKTIKNLIQHCTIGCEDGECISIQPDAPNDKCAEQACKATYSPIGVGPPFVGIKCLEWGKMVQVCSDETTLYLCEGGETLKCAPGTICTDTISGGSCVGTPTPGPSPYPHSPTPNPPSTPPDVDCRVDSDCVDSLNDCLTTCYKGKCLRVSTPPKSPCTGAEWQDYPTCGYDAGSCAKPTCGTNEILSDDGKCSCKDGYTRVAGNCQSIEPVDEPETNTTYLIIGGVILLIIGMVILGKKKQ